MRCRPAADGLEKSRGAPVGGASFWDEMRKEVGPSPTSSLFFVEAEGRLGATLLL